MRARRPSRRVRAHSRGAFLGAVALALAFAAPVARADAVVVYAAGAAREAVLRLVPIVAQATGDEIVPTFDTVGALRDRVLAGERPDVVVLSAAAVDTLVSRGAVARDSVRPVGDVVVGLAVRRGAPLPDISTPEALARTLVGAPSIAYADPARGATAGTHFAAVLDRLGVRADVAPRASVLPFGVEVVEAVAQGRVALGVSQSSEIVQHPGVSYVGGLPSPHALATGYALAPLSGRASGARVAAVLAGPLGLAAFRETGFAAR